MPSNPTDPATVPANPDDAPGVRRAASAMSAADYLNLKAKARAHAERTYMEMIGSVDHVWRMCNPGIAPPDQKPPVIAARVRQVVETLAGREFMARQVAAIVYETMKPTQRQRQAVAVVLAKIAMKGGLVMKRRPSRYGSLYTTPTPTEEQR